MITAKQFALLKKGNAAVNAEKCKARVPSAFKSATTEQRKQIFELSGLKSPNSFYPIEKSGSASPKVILSLAQVLSISPFYLSGESEDKTCNDGVLTEFFKKCTAGNVKTPRAKTPTKSKTNKPAANKVTDKPAKVKAIPKKKQTAPAKTAKVPAVKAIATKEKLTTKPVKTDNNKQPAIETNESAKIDYDKLVVLLEGCKIRADIGNKTAKATYNQIVELLSK